MSLTARQLGALCLATQDYGKALQLIRQAQQRLDAADVDTHPAVDDVLEPLACAHRSLDHQIRHARQEAPHVQPGTQPAPRHGAA